GDYATAIARYNAILNAPGVNDALVAQTEKHLARAEEEKSVPKADAIYEEATTNNTVSGIFNAYLKGYNWYPNDNRFVEGLKNSEEQLFDWAVRQHHNARYSTAIKRYEMIINAPIAEEDLLNRVNRKMEQAQNEERPADVIYQLAQEEPTASGKLELNLEGYETYPDDDRFNEGLKNSTDALYKWATSKHQSGNFETANDRYAKLLEVPNLSSELEKLIQIRKSYAEDGQRTPSVSGFLNEAENEDYSSAKLNVLADGYHIHNGNQQIVEHINQAAASLLNWATSKHLEGEYDTAEARYQKVLNTPGISDKNKEVAESKLQYAENDEPLPNADDLYNEYEQETTASGMLETSSLGYRLYPNDQRFEDALYESVDALLNWATSQHEEQRYDTAADRYSKILATPVIDQLLANEAEIKLDYAEDQQSIPSADNLYSQAESDGTASGSFELFEKGLILYPDNQELLSGLNSSAMNLFLWAKNQHEDRRYQVAIKRYDKLINSPVVSDSIKNIASRNKENAQNQELPTRQIIDRTYSQDTIFEALNSQLSLSIPPQTDKYRNDTGYIHSDYVSSENTGVITGSGVNLRVNPNLNDDPPYNVGEGTTFKMLGTVDGENVSGSTKWYHIKYDGEELYVHSSLAKETSGLSLTQTANVYEKTSTDSHVFDTLTVDDNLTVVEKTGDWYEVELGLWTNAKSSEVMSYLNPENNDVYQHLVLDSSPGVTANQLNRLLTGRGILEGAGQAFIDAGLEHSVNEVYLISHAILETGAGTDNVSPLATGVKVGKNDDGDLMLVSSENEDNLSSIKTVYNMFGIDAVDDNALSAGARKAYREGWFSPEEAIKGGAEFIGERYIHSSYNQNTLYKMRWNPENPGNHQYATDMGWAVKQVSTMKNMYNQLDNPILHFDIPEYR
ncbi:mannosyl-glycoprotein endo-beta-N-acetylglucosaminidase, partial [Gracilibacillus halophilus YIM-C55.5]